MVGSCPTNTSSGVASICSSEQVSAHDQSILRETIRSIHSNRINESAAAENANVIIINGHLGCGQRLAPAAHAGGRGGRGGEHPYA